jgi:drug/metabolite transporter, DME family
VSAPGGTSRSIEPSKVRLLGYAEALAAACMWGSSGIFAVHLFRLGIPPASLALLRPVVGSVLLLAFIGLTRPSALRIPKEGIWVLLLGGGSAIAVFQIAYQLSTDAVGVPSTVALLYLAPAIVAAASGPLLGEWPDRVKLALLAVTLAGVWLSVWGANEVSATFGTTGLAWGILAGASYAIYTLFGRFAAPRYGTLPTVVYSTVGSCIILSVVVPITTGPVIWPSSVEAWGLLLAFGALTIAAAHFLFFDALTHLDASRVSITTAVEPVVASVLATVLLSQGLSPLGWVGIGLVVVGVAGVGLTTSENR